MDNITEHAASQSEGITVLGLHVTRGDFNLQAKNWFASRGSLIGLVGVNGAGKTSFMSALAGYLQPRAGQLSIDGIPLTEFGWTLPDVIGLVPDSLSAIEDYTVADHLVFLSEVYDSWDTCYAKDLVARLGIPCTKPLKTLSRGNRMKAAFVMVESARPPVLLLDEPTSGLDPIVRQELLTVLVELLKESPSRIVVFSSHILEDIVQVATSVSLVRRGVVLAPRRHEENSDWRNCLPHERLARLADLFDVDSFE